jgi:hypothetical protein
MVNEIVISVISTHTHVMHHRASHGTLRLIVTNREYYCHLMHHADDSRLLVPPAYISADIPLAQKEAIAAVRLAAAPIECNTKHSVAYTQRKCQRCGIGVDNEHHLLFDCSHAVLVANRTNHRALFDGVSGVREWMAAAYKP